MSLLKLWVTRCPIRPGIGSFLLLLLILCGSPVYSQLIELDGAINQMMSSTDPSELANGESLRHLSFDLVPTANLQGGVLTLPENESAQVLSLHAADLNVLQVNLETLNSLEMIRIIISNDADLAAAASLNQINTSSKIEIICEMEVDSTTLAQAIGSTGNHVVYYSISVPR